jgi:tripartite-type tricarboxylate transporter receptor subunit TctC
MKTAKILIVGLALASGGAIAQSYPSKPIRFIVPWPPGGGADVLSRIVSPKLGEALGQQVVIDNRGGAAGNIGAEMAAKSPPDGYTIVFAYAGTHAINPSIYSKLPFKESDFAPIIWTAEVPQVLVVHPSLPVKNVKDVIALAKSKPDQLSYGSSGSGAMNHLTGALFTMMTNTKIVHVPYKGGGPAAIALLSGEISMIFGEPATVVQQIKAGKVRAIAVTSTKRALALPDLPTIAESGVPGYELTSWVGFLAPAATPRAVITRIHATLVEALRTPSVRDILLKSGAEPLGNTPEEFQENLKREIPKWNRIIKAAGVTLE